MNARADNRRGQQQLRVSVNLGPESVEVDRMWVVDQPAVQTERLVGPILVMVDTGGPTTLVQSFPDPRITRSTASDERGHHFGLADSGTLVVTVPFTSTAELADVHVLLADVSGMDLEAASPQEVAALFDDRPRAMGRVRGFSTTELRRSPDWDEVASRLGLSGGEGVFQVYQDAADEYRWRLLRGAEIVADSGQGYVSREACEADLQWLREHAGLAAVTVEHLPEAPDR